MNLKQQMDLLNIKDVSTPRQTKNGTVVWRLPIRNNNSGKTFIEVASFKTGYVRNQNSGYSNYQLNKRIFVDDYYPEYKSEQGHCVKTGKYHKYKLKSCILIPNEKDRLEYLISYCLKNYYIKNANEVTNSYDCGCYDRIKDLEEDLVNMTEARDYYKDKIKNLENKLDKIKTFLKHEL